jgi:hypothetical protein
MTISLTPLPAPAWLRDLTEARAMYEELLGWPVSVQVGRRDLVLIAGGTVGAIGMPARLGARVRQELNNIRRPGPVTWPGRRSQLPSRLSLLSGPIVADPGGSWWTFLTRPVGVLRPDVTHDLSAVRVRIAPRGACVEIPGSINETRLRSWRWVERPRPNRPLPPGAAVISMVRRLTYDDGQLAA